MMELIGNLSSLFDRKSRIFKNLRYGGPDAEEYSKMIVSSSPLDASERYGKSNILPNTLAC